MKRIIPLWCVPRSVSTAFERMMMVRGDFKVLHEPFSYFFYVRRQAAAAVHMNVDPQAPVEFDDILRNIQAAAAEENVFFKDMCYHAACPREKELLQAMENTFLICDPARALPSLYRMNPEFTLEETGYEAQARFFSLVAEITGKPPIAVDTDDLLENPPAVIQAYCRSLELPYLPESLSWEPTFPPEWKSWEKWHLDAAASRGFVKQMEVFDFTIDDIPRLREAYAFCKPFYDQMRPHRIGAQKV